MVIQYSEMRHRIFSEGERVLCFEPDPSRLRVLYDAKILQVSQKEDHVEYYIHFLGWSSSWDRYISETLLLENNEENRQKQSLLNAEANKLLPKKKRRANGSSSTVSESSRDSSDEESEDEAVCEQFDLPLPKKLRERLDFEQTEIKSSRLHKLPSNFDIVSILENYVQHYAFQIQYVQSVDNSAKRMRCRDEQTERKTNLELCKETVDGLRILFNQVVHRILLYNEEIEQFSKLNELVFQKDFVEQKQSRRTRELDLLLAQLEDSFLADKIPQAWDNETHRGRSLRVSTQHASIASGTLKREADDSDSATITSWVSTPCNSMIEDAKKWKILDDPQSPAQICGAYHLLRLLSRIPEIVPNLKMAQVKSMTLKKHLRLFLNYLSENEHLFENDFVCIASL